MSDLPGSDIFITDIQHNCDVSDARDHGIYSMCSMVLKLRNLYKWEKGIPPWGEPEPAALLDWIDAKETYWETLAGKTFKPLHLSGEKMAPFDIEKINSVLNNGNLVYGAGYGRSMKSVFFLAEIKEQFTRGGCPVLVLGEEKAKELASPFAMAQNGMIIIRTQALRYFLWDHFQELRSTCRSTMRYIMDHYGLLRKHVFDHDRLKEKLDTIVEEELDLFIFHEVGEVREQALDTGTLQKIVGRFPGSVIEFVARSVKDLLADTHSEGPLSYILRERRQTSLSLYLGFLDGLREKLFPEIAEAWAEMDKTGDWGAIEDACSSCRDRNLQIASKISEITESLDMITDVRACALFNRDVIEPLGLDVPMSVASVS